MSAEMTADVITAKQALELERKLQENQIHRLTIRYAFPSSVSGFSVLGQWFPLPASHLRTNDDRECYRPLRPLLLPTPEPGV